MTEHRTRWPAWAPRPSTVALAVIFLATLATYLVVRPPEQDPAPVVEDPRRSEPADPQPDGPTRTPQRTEQPSTSPSPSLSLSPSPSSTRPTGTGRPTTEPEPTGTGPTPTRPPRESPTSSPTRTPTTAEPEPTDEPSETGSPTP